MNCPQDISQIVSESGNKLTDIQTGSLISYPSPYRMIEVDEKGFNVTSDYIDFDINGIPFSKISMDFALKSYRAIVPKMLENILIKAQYSQEEINSILYSFKNIEVLNGYTLNDVISLLIIKQAVGDESIPIEFELLANEFIKSEQFAYKFLGNMILSIGKDSAPSDINTFIEK